MAEGDIAQPSLSQDDEGKFIDEHLSYIQKFLTNMREREDSFPSEIKSQFNDFKENINKILLPASSKNDGDSDTLSELANGRCKIPKCKRPINDASDSLPETDVSRQDVHCRDGSITSITTLSSENEVTFKPRTDFTTNAFNFKQWKEVFDRLDNRRTPALEKFDENSGLDLAKYLRKFETYCSSNFRGGRNSWIGELEMHLEGKSLAAFKALRSVHDSYDTTKTKLLEWFNDMKELRQENNKLQFKNAKQEHEENMSLFGTRLERLFNLAYPLRKSDNSRTLQDKFISSVPRGFRKVLDSQIMTSKIKEQPMTWKAVMKCARLYDLQCEKRKDNESEAEVVINLGQRRKQADASIQCTDISFNDSERTANFTRQESGNRNARLQRHFDDQPTRYERQPRSTERTTWNNNFRRNVDFRSMAKRCTYCKRMGHEINDCRSRWKQCFICGSGEHFLRDCPDYNSQSRPQRPQVNGRSSSQPPRNNNRLRGNSQSATRSESTAYLQNPQRTLNRNALANEW